MSSPSSHLPSRGSTKGAKTGSGSGTGNEDNDPNGQSSRQTGNILNMPVRNTSSAGAEKEGTRGGGSAGRASLGSGPGLAALGTSGRAGEAAPAGATSTTRPGSARHESTRPGPTRQESRGLATAGPSSGRAISTAAAPAAMARGGSAASGTAGAAASPIPDDDDAIEPPQLPMSASVVLTALPHDAHAALERAGENSKAPKKGN